MLVVHLGCYYFDCSFGLAQIGGTDIKSNWYTEISVTKSREPSSKIQRNQICNPTGVAREVSKI